MPIRHSVRHRPEVRGITSRRVAAAQRALRKERNRYALFADQLDQDTPQERIAKADRQLLSQEQGHRDLHAKHWRWGRTQLAQQTKEVRREILAAWNRSSIPPTASYFADFVRSRLARLGILIVEDA